MIISEFSFGFPRVMRVNLNCSFPAHLLYKTTLSSQEYCQDIMLLTFDPPHCMLVRN